ncbi:MAG: hypothetical protein K5879_02550 [Lachnospiraceae bacterium]|nr:hypothetical protein [Lachnospiraceae bacterium]
MACFLVPATEAVVTTIITKVVEAREKKAGVEHVSEAELKEVKTPFSKKMKWLNGLLWGGSVLLAFEHLWHGEITPFFPFLTAMADPAETADMLHEMATSGVAMAAVVTLVWGGVVIVSGVLEKRAAAEKEAEETQ